LLKDYNSYLSNECKRENLITANEGTAIAAAAGHYMATKEPAMVFLQNSGLGNCMNPLLSLTHRDVYKIPFCMMIGYGVVPRRECGLDNCAQHGVSCRAR